MTGFRLPHLPASNTSSPSIYLVQYLVSPISFSLPLVQNRLSIPVLHIWRHDWLIWSNVGWTSRPHMSPIKCSGTQTWSHPWRVAAVGVSERRGRTQGEGWQGASVTAASRVEAHTLAKRLFLRGVAKGGVRCPPWPARLAASQLATRRSHAQEPWYAICLTAESLVTGQTGLAWLLSH